MNLFLLGLVTRGRYRTYDVDVIRQIRLLNVGTTLGITVLLILGVVAFIQGNTILGAVDCVLALILSIILVYSRQSQNYRAGLHGAIGFYFIMCLYLLVTGGAYETGYVWSFTFPLMACFGLGSRSGSILTIILLLSELMLFALDSPPGAIAIYSGDFKIRFVSAFSVIAAMAFIVERVREDTQNRLGKKNDELHRAVAGLHLAEQKLRQAGRDLEKRVEERTRQLASANSQLMEEMQERRQAETALRESEEKYRLIAENTADIIAIMDMEKRFTYVSPSLMRILGFSDEEAKGSSLKNILTAESLKTAAQVLQEELALESAENADPDRIRILELEHYKKDGTPAWLEVSLSFLRNSSRKAIGMLTVSRNISERKQAEMEKQRMAEQLHQAQKLESIGTLAGGIAHDFNNLLMGIQGYATLMRLDLDSSHPHYGRLQQIEEQVASGADLTKQLLGFAREGRYQVSVTDMNDLIRRTSSIFTRTKKEISVKTRLDMNLRHAMVDTGQIEQALMHLYVNAGQAMPAGGTLTLETENTHLESDQSAPYAVEPGDFIKITIQDNGIGMDEKILKRIFDPFFTTKGMGRGTGLGLAMVYGIIKGHDGGIAVTSTLGRGTTFTIYLPATEDETLSEQPVSKTIAKGTEKILLVDDEPMVLDANRKILEALGYEVCAAKNGQEAISLLWENRDDIALVILDMVMPGMSGGDTFDRLRAIRPDIPVILCSGYSLEGEAQEILDRGCNRFLQKPFDIQDFSRMIRSLLDGLPMRVFK